MMAIKKDYSTKWWALAVFVFSWMFFKTIIYLNVKTDLQAHISFILDVQNGKTPPINFLFYLTVYLFGFGTMKASVLSNATVTVLAASISAKFWITKMFLNENSKDILPSNDYINRNKFFLLNIAAVGMCLAFNLPNVIADNFYLGQVPPNIWHNSTLIFLMPFALLLFWNSLKQLENPTNKRLIVLHILVLLNLLIKPSFIFVFAPAYTILLLHKWKISKETIKQGSVVIFALALLKLEHWLLFKIDTNSVYDLGEASAIVIRPFWMWSQYSKNIPFSIFISLIYVLVYLMFYVKTAIRSKSFVFSGILYLGSLLIFILFAETGHRQFYGNFSWQNIISAYLLFLTCLTLHLKSIFKKNRANKKDWVILFCFALHVLTGILYMIRLIIRDTYY